MRWNHLVHWMTHAREGPWGGFKEAVQAMLSEGESASDLSRDLRLHLSDFGDADFFVAQTGRWRMRPPSLSELAGRNDEVLLTGSRTRVLVERVAVEAAAAGCGVAVEGHEDGPSIYRLTGPAEAMAAVARSAGIRFARGMAQEICAEGIPVAEYLRHPPSRTTPPNWIVKSFDFGTMALCDGPRRNAACECTPRFGLAQWYLQLRHGVIPMPKREAIYAAAMLQRFPLIEYSPDRRTLAFPAKLPMPELYMRTACLCSGRRAQMRDGRATFTDVPPRIAAMLCAATGQPLPRS